MAVFSEYKSFNIFFMSDYNENSFSAYLGPEFQQKLIWQILVEPEFAEKILPDLSVEYFDDPHVKRLLLIIDEYFKEYEKVPNLQNQSIYQAINKFKTPNNLLEEEYLFAVVKRIELWNERVLNKSTLYDGDIVQKTTNDFIKQQRYRKLFESGLNKIKTGNGRDKFILSETEEELQKIGQIGDNDDYGTDAFENIDKVLSEEFRRTIPTGIGVLDMVTGGGLGKGEIGIILAPSGTGKAQPLSAKILTPTGWVRMGHIRVNDNVVGSDGKSQKVLGVFPQGKRPIYRVEFNDNTSTMCDEEHIWSVNSHKQRECCYSLNGKTIHTPDRSFQQKTLKEIIIDYNIEKPNQKLNYRIPIINAVEFTNIELPVDPYLLGVLIGDGGLAHNGIRFTSPDSEIIENIRIIVQNTFPNLHVNELGKSISYGINGTKNVKNPLNTIINDLGLKLTSDKKFIPEIYKYSNIEDRLGLLQGLLDTDGYASKKGRVQYTTTSEILAYDVRELVLSLGGFCSMKTKIPKYRYNGELKIGKLVYTLTLSFSDENLKLFRLKRKQDRVIYRNLYSGNKYIKNITYSHEEEAQCIYVENEDHLYVTDDYILTHNTTLLTKIANTAREADYNVLQIIFEDTEDQVKRKHYAIWSDIALSKMQENKELVKTKITNKVNELGNNGRLIIKKMSQEDTTMKTVRNWVIRYQKKFGFKFDIIVLDYLDCLSSHKKTNSDHESELVIIKSFEAMASDFDIPCWSAVQSNRMGQGAEIVGSQQTGGNIKRLHKAHLFFSVAKTDDQKEAHLANINIIKARFAQDGQIFKDCIFNNDTMKIIIKDDRYKGNGKYFKKYGEEVSLESNSVSETTQISDNSFGDVVMKDLLDSFLSEELNKAETISDIPLNVLVGQETDVKEDITIEENLETNADLNENISNDNISVEDSIITSTEEIQEAIIIEETVDNTIHITENDNSILDDELPDPDDCEENETSLKDLLAKKRLQ